MSGDKSYLLRSRRHQPDPGEPVPALCLRHMDDADVSSHPIRTIRGRLYLLLPKRRRGSCIIEALEARFAACGVLHAQGLARRPGSSRRSSRWSPRGPDRNSASIPSRSKKGRKDDGTGSSDGDFLFEVVLEQAPPERAGDAPLRYAERDQVAWRPVSLDGLLADDHKVRLVWHCVEQEY
jgi:hypothetical protein